MLSDKLKDSFFTIVRLGIGKSTYSQVSVLDWNVFEALANEQGLSAILVDGVEKLSENERPRKSMLLQWIGDVIQGYEYRYGLYSHTIAEMAGWHNTHGYKMMVLKGYACAMNWPKPEHRPCGDIDIWQFGNQKVIDAMMVKEKDIKIDSSHHHHTVYEWNEFTVENHYDFLNVHHHKSNMELEAVLKELGQDDSHYIEVYGEKVYLPSPNLHALFLLRHTMSNFASTGMSLRQLLDWAFFVEKQGKDVDWKWLLDIINQYGMRPLFDVFNAICVEDLGFDISIFPYVQFDPKIKNRVLNDILSREFTEKERGGLFCRAIFKYRRWKANSWKHELCFNDSMSSALWSGVKSHLMKPSSI